MFDMFMNGEYVGSGPARLKGDTINYNTFDVTQYIKRNNVLGAICYTNESKMFLAQLTFFIQMEVKRLFLIPVGI